MTILLVGENIDRRRAHAQASAGELIQLVRGVYAQANADVDTAVLAHAVRIAHYLYPAAYLSSASAALLRPTSYGRLFLSGRRNQRNRIRTLEIVQNEAPAHPSTAPAIVGDDQGEIRIEGSSPRQRFLEAFRLRSEHASAITDELRADMAARLVEEFGSPQAAADALWALARENGWYREGEGAERYLTTRSAVGKPAANKAALERIVAWHGEPLGRLTHDGFEWRWKAAANAAPSLVRQTAPGKLPACDQRRRPREGCRQGRRIGQDPESQRSISRRVDLSACCRSQEVAGLIRIHLPALQRKQSACFARSTKSWPIFHRPSRKKSRDDVTRCIKLCQSRGATKRQATRLRPKA
ncbi:hypothetical protein ACVIHI_000229 [Bradyrhizobium sp. USDA 4524]|uniref:hypothetical protein n=1 Tax=unclassified Bradyrhizobium TaxID=2631580 RepID=UPI002810B6A0|nr:MULTISPECIES: hypothetical protein [unclassified Bradyrhizobium]MCP1838402.1 hypothetical protein [Bradyrhizobium sp. USDA 4538]MCP1898966.1 hypothetical protein [Bradyrhizobium sp. USDA 4537]MCP1986920.1 hypothetical protein [Bradyrhizobium sp. USDA 4539]